MAERRGIEIRSMSYGDGAPPLFCGASGMFFEVHEYPIRARGKQLTFTFSSRDYLSLGVVGRTGTYV